MVGTGTVGERKAVRLTNAGTTPLLIGTRVTSLIQALALAGKVRLHKTQYRPELLAGATLVFAATSNVALNARIARDARSVGALINLTDNPASSDFFNVSDVTSGDVQISVSTGGRSPAFARALRKRLQTLLPIDLAGQLAHFERWREEVEARFPLPEVRQRVWDELDRRDIYSALEVEGQDAAERLLNECIHAVKADDR